MHSIILDSQYFPSIQYFALIEQASVVALNNLEVFNKQSYRNRCSILSANGKLDLTVPVDHRSTRKIDGLKLSYSEKWNIVHRKSIESAYRKSPFFEYYADDILPLFNQKFDTLIDLNTTILTHLLEVLGIETKIVFCSELSTSELSSFKNLTECIHPKRPKLKSNSLPYQQVFGASFLPDLSVLDALFCLGPETQILLSETTFLE